MNYILTPQDEPPIKPEHINTKQHFWDAFGNQETETSANWIVRFCQARGEGWMPILESQLTGYYQAERGKKFEDFHYNGLRDRWIKIEEGKIILSKQFVARCYGSSPI